MCGALTLVVVVAVLVVALSMQTCTLRSHSARAEHWHSPLALAKLAQVTASLLETATAGSNSPFHLWWDVGGTQVGPFHFDKLTIPPLVGRRWDANGTVSPR